MTDSPLRPMSLALLIDRLEKLAVGHGIGTPTSVTRVEWVDGVVRAVSLAPTESTEPPMSQLDKAIARAKAFADSWAEGELIDDESGFTADDLRRIVAAAEAGKELAKLPSA